MNARNVPHVRLARIARVREENTDPSPLITPARVSAPATVTVIIPTYQAASTLDRAIASVLHQSLRSLELIVGDDASTDATRMVTQRWYLADPRVRLLNHARTLGKSAVMNNAVPFAQGEWIAVLDADDRYEPRRLERLVAMGDGAEVEMVADNQVIHDAIANADVGVAWRTPARNRDPAWRLTLDGYMQGSDVYEAFNFGMLKPLIRREFVRSTGLAYDTRARYGEDFLYLLQFFVLGGRAVICDDPYYIYTQPYGTISRQWSHVGRRRYDFRHVHELNQAYLRDYAPVLTPWQRRWLAERGRRLLVLENYFRVKELWRSASWLALCRRAALPPFALEYAVRQLARRCLRQSYA